MTSISTNAIKVREPVILTDPSSWDQWFEDTKASVPRRLCRYFDPDSDTIIEKPIEPERPIEKFVPEGNEPPQARLARLARNKH